MLLVSIALVAGAPVGAHAGDNMMDQMVRKFCLAAVNKEVADSGKPAPDGMQTFTCDCVVQQMKLKQSCYLMHQVELQKRLPSRLGHKLPCRMQS